MRVATIEDVLVRGVLHSEGGYTAEVEIRTSNGERTFAASPLGTTNGHFDTPIAGAARAALYAVELRSALAGRDPRQQREIDASLAESFGANGTVCAAADLSTAASLAVCRAAARLERMPVWMYVADTFGTTPGLPGLIVNVINGGSHNATGNVATEAMVITKTADARTDLAAVVEFYRELRKVCARVYGMHALSAGIEGGITPSTRSVPELLELITTTVAATGLDDLRIGLDMAGNVLHRSDGRYACDGAVSANQLSSLYLEWSELWPSFTYLEDPFSDGDLAAWSSLHRRLERASLGVAGDDLFGTQVERMRSLPGHRHCSYAVAKIDQNGTLSGMAEYIRAARSCGLWTVISHRSRETDQPIVADLAFGLGADYLKAGCCSRERIVKYNRVLRIADEWRESQARAGS